MSDKALLQSAFEMLVGGLEVLKILEVRSQRIDYLEHEIKDLKAEFLQIGYGPRRPKQITVRKLFLEQIEEIFSLSYEALDHDPWTKDKVIVAAHEDLLKTLDRYDQTFQISKYSEPVIRFRLHTIINFIYCQLIDNGMASTDSQKTFFQCKTELESIITFRGKRRTLTGISDYTLWYKEAADESCPLLILEAKKYEERRFFTQLLSYMGIIHQTRIREKKNDTVYGVVTNSNTFEFVCMRNKGRYSRLTYYWRAGRISQDSIVSLLARLMREAAMVSPNTSDAHVEGQQASAAVEAEIWEDVESGPMGDDDDDDDDEEEEEEEEEEDRWCRKLGERFEDAN
ncbi:hypothetical protein ASPBRDRAFT_661253 [Aspergillus brasiliensis CBS 101740]|uniref:Uncharacterized protein n=1 Tax=Aspergillus brasiliensis (strain CBS 101740 / IMI 381727 / IBT 21946) TaxID=767769 RepID=A0A1L9U6U1_ASPBC|nr:hypothetical protein ASPBRDRAFT_661253 [Aspergillus brasiliensis CBS 101740]